jgi:hypothetical protein
VEETLATSLATRLFAADGSQRDRSSNETRRSDGTVREAVSGTSSRTPFVLFAAALAHKLAHSN